MLASKHELFGARYRKFSGPCRPSAFCYKGAFDCLEAFLKRFAELFAFHERSGAIVVRAELDPETFPNWCAARSLHVDATGRAEWGNWKAVEYLREKDVFHEKPPR